MKLGRTMFNFMKGNDIGVAPNLHFIPPPRPLAVLPLS